MYTPTVYVYRYNIVDITYLIPHKPIIPNDIQRVIRFSIPQKVTNF